MTCTTELPLRPSQNNSKEVHSPKVKELSHGETARPKQERIEKVELQMVKASKTAALLHSDQILGESINLNLDSLLLTPGPLNTIPIEQQPGESQINTQVFLSGHNKTAI